MESLFHLNRRNLLKAGLASAMLPLPGIAFGQSAQPRKGGHLRAALSGGSTQDNFDPRIWNDWVMYMYGLTVRGTLVEISDTNKVVPGAAESWEPSADAKTWRFKLRKDVTFHSGKTFEADDVVATIRLHIAPDSTSSMKSVLANVDDVSADGKDTVVFRLKGGNADFPALLTAPHLCIMPSKGGQVDVTNPDGLGAYKLDHFEAGTRMSVIRNESHWNVGQAAFLDSAEILMVADPTSQLNALRSGQVDLMDRVELKTVNMMKRLQGIKVNEVESGGHNVFCMLTDQAPFTDKNVRLALKHAINRQEILDKVLLGHGALGNDQPISKFHKYFSKDVPQRQYDPDKAKFYLKQAGLDKLDVSLSVAEAGFNGSVDAGQLFAESAKAANINISTTRESDDGYYDNVWMKKPFTVDKWGFRTTEDAILTIAYARGAAYNETHFNNDRFNDLLVQARAELDEGKRGEMYHEMQMLIHEEGGSIIPHFTNNLWATRSNVMRRDTAASNWPVDGLRFIERWWLAA